MTPKQKLFIAEYLVDFNATQAAIRAGYSPKTSYSHGQRLLKNVEIAEDIARQVEERMMGLDEARTRLGRMARFDMSPYIEGYGARAVIRTDKMIADGYGDMIREIYQTSEGVRVKIADQDAALDKILKIHGAYVDRKEISGADGEPVVINVVYGNQD